MANDEEKNINDCCDDDIVHSGAVERVRAAMPDEDALYDAAELFKVFGDSTRTRILSALFVEELCVCDIAEILCMTKSAVRINCARFARRRSSKLGARAKRFSTRSTTSIFRAFTKWRWNTSAKASKFQTKSRATARVQ